jgi:hypothetical protein
MNTLALGLILLGVFVISVVIILGLLHHAIKKGLRTGRGKFGKLTIPILILVILSNIGWWGGWICLLIALLQHLEVI